MLELPRAALPAYVNYPQKKAIALLYENGPMSWSLMVETLHSYGWRDAERDLARLIARGTVEMDEDSKLMLKEKSDA